MKKVKNLIGIRKRVYENYIKIYVFFHFVKEIITGKFPANGRKPKNFYRFLKRLLFFLSKMKDNKYVKSGRYTKISLYVPAFPSEAFFKACKKIIVTDKKGVKSKMPCVSVLLSVTSACRYNCEHCYQKLDYGKDVDIDALCGVTRQLDEMGVSFFNIEGGEPFLVFERLKKLCESIKVGEIWVNSTGDGVTSERLNTLKELGVKGLMFSLHSAAPEKINSFMQSDKAWDNLKNGIELCREAGLEVATNTCILKDDFYNGQFEAILDLAKDLGVSIIQLIKPKPSGGWLGAEMDNFTKEDLDYIEKVVFKYNNHREYKDYPFIAAQIVDEKSDLFGCTAGGTDRFYINAKGDVQPCEFLNISYGNITKEDFKDIYIRMRNSFNEPGDLWLCEVCTNKIKETVVENNIKILPLNKELSLNVINNWQRGNVPDFYKKVVEL
jgi:MoaA/NifB/PqqE/SkfB family radical SAM enzyme